MGFVSLKAWVKLLVYISLPLTVIFFFTGYLWGFGLHVETNPYKCLGGYAFQFEDWHRLGSIGWIELRYRPIKRVCGSFEYRAKDGFKPLIQTNL